MNKQQAKDVLTRWRNVNYGFQPTTDEDDAIQTLLTEPEWVSLEQRPLTKEDVGKWAWVEFRHLYEPKISTIPIEIIECPPYAISFNGMEPKRVIRFSFIGFAPPAPKEESIKYIQELQPDGSLRTLAKAEHAKVAEMTRTRELK